MWKFLSHVLILFFLTSVILIFADRCVTNGLRKSNDPLFQSFTEIFSGKANADLIVNGNSRARNQIDPRILDSLLLINSYNIGQNGSGFGIQRLMYKLYRKYNRKPDYILHVVDNGTFEFDGGLYERIKFAPYLNDSLVQATVMDLEGFDKLDQNIPFFKYSGFPVQIINGISSFLGLKRASKQELYKGFPKPYPEWNDVIFESFKEEFPNGTSLPVDNRLLRSMNEYIDQCKREGIDVVLVYPPTYYEAVPYFLNDNEVREAMTSLSKENNLLLLDYSTDSLSLSKEYFVDYVHLNKKGTDIFTRKISEALKKHLNFAN